MSGQMRSRSGNSNVEPRQGTGIVGNGVSYVLLWGYDPNIHSIASSNAAELEGGMDWFRPLNGQAAWDITITITATGERVWRWLGDGYGSLYLWNCLIDATENALPHAQMAIPSYTDLWAEFSDGRGYDSNPDGFSSKSNLCGSSEDFTLLDSNNTGGAWVTTVSVENLGPTHIAQSGLLYWFEKFHTVAIGDVITAIVELKSDDGNSGYMRITEYAGSLPRSQTDVFTLDENWQEITLTRTITQDCTIWAPFFNIYGANRVDFRNMRVFRGEYADDPGYQRTTKQSFDGQIRAANPENPGFDVHGDSLQYPGPIALPFEISEVYCPLQHNNMNTLRTPITIAENDAFVMTYKGVEVVGGYFIGFTNNDSNLFQMYFQKGIGSLFKIGVFSHFYTIDPVGVVVVSRPANSDQITVTVGEVSETATVSNAGFVVHGFGWTFNNQGYYHGLSIEVNGSVVEEWPMEDGTPDNPSTVLHGRYGNHADITGVTDWEAFWAGVREGDSYNAKFGYNRGIENLALYSEPESSDHVEGVPGSFVDADENWDGLITASKVMELPDTQSNLNCRVSVPSYDGGYGYFEFYIQAESSPVIGTASDPSADCNLAMWGNAVPVSIVTVELVQNDIYKVFRSDFATKLEAYPGYEDHCGVDKRAAHSSKTLRVSRIFVTVDKTHSGYVKTTGQAKHGGYIPASATDPTKDVLGNDLVNLPDTWNNAPIKVRAKQVPQLLQADLAQYTETDLLQTPMTDYTLSGDGRVVGDSYVLDGPGLGLIYYSPSLSLTVGNWYRMMVWGNIVAGTGVARARMRWSNAASLVYEELPYAYDFQYGGEALTPQVYLSADLLDGRVVTVDAIEILPLADAMGVLFEADGTPIDIEQAVFEAWTNGHLNYKYMWIINQELFYQNPLTPAQFESLKEVMEAW